MLSYRFVRVVTNEVNIFPLFSSVVIRNIGVENPGSIRESKIRVFVAIGARIVHTMSIGESSHMLFLYLKISRIKYIIFFLIVKEKIPE